MAVDWEGPNKKSSWGRGEFACLKWMILLGALRTTLEPIQAEEIENIEDLADFNDPQMGKLSDRLPQSDPIREFLRKSGRGKLTPKESTALATRLAEITYFLTVKREEHERFIFLPHMVKRRARQDNQLKFISLLMWECASAAEKAVDTSLGTIVKEG